STAPPSSALIASCPFPPVALAAPASSAEGRRGGRYTEPVPQDTTPAAAPRYHELLRSQSPASRLAQAAALTRAVRQLAEAGIRQRHPGASDAEVRIRLAVRIYGRDVATRLFGAVPAD